MGRRRRSWPGLLALAFAQFTLAACDEAVTAVQINRPGGPQAGGQDGLLVCDAPLASSITAEIGPEGGILSLGGHRLVVPRGALNAPVSITMAVPATETLELRFTVEDEPLFVFLRDVVVEISYARCLDQVGDSPLRVWQLDPVTRLPVLDHGGVDDPSRMTLTITTLQLSTFVVAR